MVLLYHYTDQAGLDAIYLTNTVKASAGGAAGPGVYFTQLDPTTPKEKIAQNNWCTSDTSKTRFWYKFKTEDYPAIKQVCTGSRDIWLHNGDMKLHENSQVKLYHYTDRAGKDGINSSGIIRKNKPQDVTKKDGTVTALAAGVYFTELRPEHSTDRGKRMRRVFGSSASHEGKTQFWFWFRVGNLKGVRKQRSAHGGYEWVFEGDVDVRIISSRSQPLPSMVFLYHYTDVTGWNGIISSGKIMAQSPHGGQSDMRTGVYLTEIEPKCSDKTIIWNMYNLDDRKRNSNLERRCGFYFQFDSRMLRDVEKNKPVSGRNEWLCPDDVMTALAETCGQRKNNS